MNRLLSCALAATASTAKSAGSCATSSTRLYHSCRLALPRYDPHDSRGWGFNFRLASDLRESALRSDRPSGADAPIHRLRKEAFEKLRGGDSTSSAPASDLAGSGSAGGGIWDNFDCFFDPRPADIEGLFGEDARGRLQPRWLEIVPDARRDRAIRRSLKGGEIMERWDQIVTKAEAEESLKEPLSKLCTSLRDSFRRQLPELSDGRGDDGWGRCVPNGRVRVKNHDETDLEESEVDIAFVARVRGKQPDNGELEWPNVIASIAAKPSHVDDLSTSLTLQCFQDARRVIEHHPFCTRSHQVTINGTRIRLWQFTPSWYATSRAYSLSKKGDRLAIGRILALLTTARPDSLIREWAPPPKFDVQVPRAAHGTPHLESTEVQQWEWIEKAPRVIHSRPEVCGIRATVSGGPARLVRPATARLDAKAAKLDIDGSRAQEGWLTMVKCSFLPEYLLNHEAAMQQHIVDVPGAPVPIGRLSVDVPASTPPSDKPEGGAQHVHALAYQHTLGDYIPDTLSEVELCDLFEELNVQLKCISEAGAQYRDLNTGNLLCKIVDGTPRLILVDHGNMRLDGEPRGARGLRNDRNGNRKDAFFAIAEDDARSANPVFLPVSMSFVEDTMQCLRAEQAYSPNPRRQRRSKADASYTQHRRDLLLHAHSHIDDLESSCYVHVWFGHRRSFARIPQKSSDLMRELSDLKSKSLLWADETQWSGLLAKYCPAMSEPWRAMMEDLRDAIRSAQIERRKALESDPDKQAKDPAEIFKITDIERRCFDDCLSLYQHFRRHLGRDNFKVLELIRHG